MLNPTLYEELARVFEEEPEIAAENTPGTFSCPDIHVPKFGKGPIRRYIQAENWGEVYRINCPVCGDTRRRLFFSHMAFCTMRDKGDKGKLYHAGSIYVCHNEHCDLWRYVSQLDKEKLEQATISLNPSTMPMYSIPKTFGIPSPAFPLTDDRVPEECLRYVHQVRQFSCAELYAKYGVLYAPANAMYRNGPEPDKAALAANPELAAEAEKLPLRNARLVIPVMHGYKLVGWQARAIEDGVDPKYLFPKVFKKSHFLYNLDAAKFNDNIIITEGVTDVWRVGKNAVSLFGKVASERQIQIMRVAFGFSARGFVLLDSDAENAADKLVKQLTDANVFPGGVTKIALSGGDPADLSATQVDALLEEYNARPDP